MIVPAKGTPIFLSPKLEEKHLSKITIECEIKAYWEATSAEGENWYDILGTIIKPFKRVGVENTIAYNILNKVVANEIIHLDIVDEMRKIKTPYEIEMIRNTSELSDLGMKKIFENAYVGASVLEMFTLSGSIQRELIREKNFDPILTSLTSVVWPSPMSSMPHSIPGLDDRLIKGSNIAMTYFKVNGYASECERTFFLGEPNNQDIQHFNHMMNARNIALNLVKPGTRCSDIDIAAREYLIKEGYENNLLHRTGHGIGLSNHETPFISIGDDEILKESMVISIEPGIYIDGVGGYRHSDTVLITKNGYELLTKFPTDINSMTITNKNIISKIKGKFIRQALKLN
ncbi:Xaa-Pro peptidase family protein [Clostridium sp. OS1-26]|uniref:M24 family metallopeptidase n=1 Tax=Clostridium sp. OS1-26 TaxID=3070681 RepID=UPI0027E0510D|nr:Xaa-Pro peptidase family protein [Clostridium sp. OS1-26]WML36361.1 Xaa-Pro peptidase family protein [Clostridium sp. OS1-26]